MDTIRAVCFDAFGTVVEVTDKRRTFQGLFNNIYTEIAIRAMTQPIDLRTAVKFLNPPPKEEEIVGWEADIAAECASIKLRPGIKAVWATLKRAQLKIAVCSNLAAPYAMPMFDALPDELDGLVLSYRVGLMKPHKEIYSLVASQLRLKLPQILFVGDRIEEDVIGPAAAGAPAMPIGEFETFFGFAPSIFAPPNIVELFERIGAAKAKTG